MLSKRFSQVLVDHAHPLFSLIGHLATLPEKAALSLFPWTVVLRGHVRDIFNWDKCSSYMRASVYKVVKFDTESLTCRRNTFVVHNKLNPR